MLLELAIGDAYGAGFEYASPQIITQSNHLSQYVPHPRHFSPLAFVLLDTLYQLPSILLTNLGELGKEGNAPC